MDNLIDRQAAISAICNACGKIDCDKMDKCEKLQLPPANNSEIPNSSDTISRQAAIDTFKDCAKNGVGIDGIVDALESLPSAQLERIKGGGLQRKRKICSAAPNVMRSFIQNPNMTGMSFISSAEDAERI